MTRQAPIPYDLSRQSWACRTAMIEMQHTSEAGKTYLPGIQQLFDDVGASDAPRTVLIEQMKRPGWTFKAVDMTDGTPTKDRIKLVVKAGETKVVRSTLSIVNEECGHRSRDAGKARGTGEGEVFSGRCEPIA